MITLQRTIAYAGDPAASPLKTITIVLQVPIYEYTGGGDGQAVARRATSDVLSASLQQPLDGPTYRIALDDSFIAGGDAQTSELAKEYTKTALQSGSADDLAVDALVRYLSDAGDELGRESLSLVCVPKLDLQAKVALEARAPASQQAFLAVNRSAFISLQSDLGGPAAASDGLLLRTISVLTAVDDVDLAMQDERASQRWIDDQWARTGEVGAQKVVTAIKAAFAELYDFPLAIPEIKALSVAGTLRIAVANGRPLSAKDFLPYVVSAECIYAGSDTPIVPSFRFDDQVAVNAGAASFLLSADAPVLRNELLDPVTVTVKGIDGSVIWSKGYTADDPILAALEITVPLQGSVTLAPAPGDADREQAKRIRGRVLTLEKDCVLKDALVLLQAKANDKDDWRVVGAATTDAAGNFSTPYPYGSYAQAQAIVSLAPKEPTGITVVPDHGSETISDDFLYLLLQTPTTAPPPAVAEECNCSAVGEAARLPDYADLIGSDAYSQDIGGSCVNLSTPNRTISEFDYQAIVRTSDPDVASFVLNKIEASLDSVDASLAAALATSASALASATAQAVTDANANPAGGSVFTQAAAQAAAQVVGAAFQQATAVASALNQAPGAISLTVLADTVGHVDALIGTLGVSEAILPGNNRAGGSSEQEGILAAAIGLKGLLGEAIDGVGTSARYELTAAQSKTIRRPIDSDNPVDWQDAPESQPAQVVVKHARARNSGALHDWVGAFMNPSVNSGGPTLPQTATLSQAVTVATGHILHYKAVFKADGYSLGDLLCSLPLAPGQKKEIVVFDASHTLVGAETQALAQTETLATGLLDVRTITDQLAGGLSESLRGSSNANTSGISAGFGTGAQGSGSTGAYGGSGSAVLGVAGGVANANASASQDSSRDVSQFFGEKLRQQIIQNADAYRQLNASVVSTVQEGQRYGVTSEVVANHNHCHALTMLYFEVLRHFAIFQELSSVEECVFVPFLLTRFTTENVAKWRDILASALLPMPSDTYLQPFSAMAGSGRQHPLIKAFDADQRIKTHYANVDYPAGAYDDEQIRFLKGEMLLRVDLPRPKTRYDRIKSLPVITRTDVDLQGTAKEVTTDAILAGLTGGLSLLFTGPPDPSAKVTHTQVKQAIFDAFMTLDANYASVPPAECIRVTNFAPTSIGVGGVAVPVQGLDFFQDGVNDRELWTRYATLLGYSDVLKMLDYYFKGRLISEWDDIFSNDIAPLVFRKIVDSIVISEIKADFTAEDKYTGGEHLMPLFLSGTTSRKRNQLPPQLKVSVNRADVQGLHDYVTLNVENATITYSTPHYNGLLYGGAVNDDLVDGTWLDIPENSDEKRNPRREDRYLAAKLIEHLNSNLEYYNKVLWYQLDPDRRFMLLDGFSIQTFKDDGTPFPGPGGMRSLASVVKNDLIGVSGNSFVLPVAPGYKVSGSFVPPVTAEGEPAVTLLDHYKPLTPVQPYRISVPSKGVFAEAVQGACNACEKVEADRLQDWSRFPIGDDTTPISPVSVPTPVVTDWQAAFKDFAAPIVNVQNAPTTPAPGAGLQELSTLLGASGVFKDITGLDATQQNVLRTYLSNQDNAKAFGEMAKEMAMQSHNTQNSDKIMDSLKSAKDSGALQQDEYGKLVKQHMQQQIDGGQAAKADAKLAAPSLTKAAVGGINRGQPVQASTGDSQGNFETVQAGQLVLTSGGRAPAQTTGVGGVVTGRPSAGSTGALEKIIDWATKLGTGVLASKEDELSQAINDAAVKIAEEELAKGVAAIPFGKALQLTVRYSTVFADAVGKVIEAKRPVIQQIVDDAVNFSGDDGLSDDDVARLRRATSYQAIAMGYVVEALKDGLEATVTAILDDATGALAEAAGEVTSQITGTVCAKLLNAAKVDRVWLAVLQEVKNDVPAARLKAYQYLATKLAKVAIASFTTSKANRARLEALLSGAAGPEPAPVGLLRSLVELGVSSAAHGLDPSGTLFPRGTEIDTLTLGKAVKFEAQRAGKAVIDELKQDGWTFGVHAGDSDIVVDEAGKHIDLPMTDAMDFQNGPSDDVLGLLDDDLNTDEQALASVYDGLEGTLILRAAGYQADVDAAPGNLGLARFDAGSAACQQDASDASLAFSNAATGLRSRYVGTVLEGASVMSLPETVEIPPASLRRPAIDTSSVA